ncbi:3882_t:CDS:1, partial [Funneliformis caledonium]
ASSNIISESPMFDTKLIGQNLVLMLVGDKKSIDERDKSTRLINY